MTLTNKAEKINKNKILNSFGKFRAIFFRLLPRSLIMFGVNTPLAILTVNGPLKK